MSKTDVAFSAALVLVTIGVALIYYPLAFIVAGGLLGGLAWVLDKGSKA